MRRGMWVRSGTRTGIVTDIDESEGSAIIDLVDDETGETVETVRRKVSAVRQARLTEIPEVRRPNDEIAKAFGYA